MIGLIGRYFRDCFHARILVVAIHHNAKKNVSRITYQDARGELHTVGIEDTNSFEGWTAEPPDGWESVREKAIANGQRWVEPSA
jgi:hypothetical protein